MMSGEHGRGARRRIAPAVIGLALALGVAAGAVVISVVTQRQVGLDDGSVWVVSAKHRKAARLNPSLGQADVAVETDHARSQVLQWNALTVLDEGTHMTALDAATVEATRGERTERDLVTAMAGGTLAVMDEGSGEVWAMAAEQAALRDPCEGSPAMRLGVDARFAVDRHGAVWGLRPSDGSVWMLARPGARAKQVTTFCEGKTCAASSFTVIDDVPVASVGSTLWFAGGRIELADADQLTLQMPPVDARQSGWVAASDRHGLHVARLKADAKPVRLPAGKAGQNARPVSSGGCVFSAWSVERGNYVRLCDPDVEKVQFETLEAVTAAADLRFQVNHRQVVLNDLADGLVWRPESSTQVLRLQWDTLPSRRREEPQDGEAAERRRRFAGECSAQASPLRAVDDAFGVRPGSIRMLDVLANDEQSDCAVLRVTHISPSSPIRVTATPVLDGRYVQVDASEASDGIVEFSYDVSNGRGQSSTARVRLDISASADRAPRMVTAEQRFDVEQGAAVAMNVLAGFDDPDGDPLMLTEARILDDGHASVGVRADGLLRFDAGGAEGGRIGVEVDVSDGHRTVSGTVIFTIHPSGSLPAELDPVMVSLRPGAEMSVDLTPYIHATGAGSLRLTEVEPAQGVTAQVGQHGLSLKVRADNPGSYHLPYTVSQGTVEATGLLRVEVSPSSESGEPPVAANDVVVLDASGSALAEPLSNDVDPAGGELAVSQVSPPADGSVDVGLEDHCRVVVASRRMPDAPVSLVYTVANAAGTSRGVITLLPPASGATGAAVSAADIEAQVRTGGIVSIDVLAHASAADGSTLRLGPDVEPQGDFSGLAFASSDMVRYQAGDAPGTFRMRYTVHDDTGNADSALITMRVHAADAVSKAAPTPRTASSRVRSGGRCRIAIDLTGIDVDGDDVQLLGLGNAAPTLGRIVEIGADWLVYEAYPDANGTDEFSYAVEDWTGQRAQGLVRVGVFRSASVTPLLARDDEVTLRPGSQAVVPVLLNDIAGAGGELRLDDQIQVQGTVTAKVRDGELLVQAADQPGTGHVTYMVRDQAGLRTSATLTVTVREDAPVSAPTAWDYRVPPVATVDKRSVEVEVTPLIANPAGRPSDLEVQVHPSASDHARMSPDGRAGVIIVDLTERSRAVPYVVTNTRDGLTATAFIHVPAYGVFPPTLRPKAPALTVQAGQTLRIALADYVRVGAGKEPRIADPGSVSATKAADGNLLEDERTLRFTAASGYAGPASITFEVSDGDSSSRSSAIVNSAVLTLPITVTGAATARPTFTSATVDVRMGETVSVDLRELTVLPDGMPSGLIPRYSGGLAAQGIFVEVSETGLLRARAEVTAKAGTSVAVPIVLTVGSERVEAGMMVRVVASRQPLARLAEHTLRLKAGEDASADVLRDAYNPFPDMPLRLVGCAAGAPAGLSVTCQADGLLRVKADAGAGALQARLTVTVEDASGDLTRRVTGTVMVAVIDLPSAPLLRAVTAPTQDGAVDLDWAAGANGGSPILEYEVSYAAQAGAASSRSCALATTCHIDGLSNGRTYTFRVRARNEVGWSAYSNAVEATPNKVPPAPEAVAIDAGHLSVTVSWRLPESDGSPPTHVTVMLDGLPGTAIVSGVSSHTFVFDAPLIRDGVSVGASVTAHNELGASAAGVSASRAMPYGDPSPPEVHAAQTSDGQVRVTARLSDMSNTGCASVTLALGSHERTVPCDRLETTFALDAQEYYTPLRPTATVRTREGPSASGKGEPVTATHTPAAPASVSVRPEGARCQVRWRPTGDTHDAYLVTVRGERHDTEATSFSYPLTVWGTCGSVSVSQSLKGHAGPSVLASNDELGNKVPAHVRAARAQWNGRDAIEVFHDIETYGQPAWGTMTVNVDGREVASVDVMVGVSSSFAIDMDGVEGEEGFTWSLRLTQGDPALIDGVGADGVVAGQDGGVARPEPVRREEESLIGRTSRPDPTVFGLIGLHAPGPPVLQGVWS